MDGAYVAQCSRLVSAWQDSIELGTTCLADLSNEVLKLTFVSRDDEGSPGSLERLREEVSPTVPSSSRAESKHHMPSRRHSARRPLLTGSEPLQRFCAL